MNNCFDNTRLLRVSLAALSKDYHFMKIKLTDIPQEGKKFTWSKESGELNKVLLDLIDDSKYEVEFYIHPLNHRDFQLSGRVQTELPEQCSHCGDDFQFAISEKFSAIITPKLHQQPVDLNIQKQTMFLILMMAQSVRSMKIWFLIWVSFYMRSLRLQYRQILRQKKIVTAIVRFAASKLMAITSVILRKCLQKKQSLTHLVV